VSPGLPTWEYATWRLQSGRAVMFAGRVTLRAGSLVDGLQVDVELTMQIFGDTPEQLTEARERAKGSLLKWVGAAGCVTPGHHTGAAERQS